MERIDKTVQKVITNGLKGILKDLDKAILQVKQDANSRGILRSSATVGAVADVCKDSAEQLRELVATQHGWAIEHCVVFTTHLKKALINQSATAFDELQAVTNERLAKLDDQLGLSGDIGQQYITDLNAHIENMHRAAITDTELVEVVKERKLLKWALSKLGRVLDKW